MKNKKILIIGKVANPSDEIIKGGISRHIKDLSEQLTDKGFQVFIWDFRLNKKYFKNGILTGGPSFKEKIINLFYSTFKIQLFTNKDFSFLSLRDKFIVGVQIQGLQKLLRENEISIVHIHSLHRPIISFIKRFFPEIKVVATDHGFWQKFNGYNDSVKLDLLNKNIECSDSVIYISDYSYRKFEEFKLDTDKLIKIPNPVNTETIPLLQLERKKNIVFNGISESLKRKNLPLLVESLNSDEFFKDYLLIAIVDDEGKMFLEKEKLTFPVSILGHQTWPEVVKIYNEGMVLAVPSKSESFGLVYMEALSVGMPIVGFNETVKEFEQELQIDIGESFNPIEENAEDLAHKIKKVILKQYDRDKLRNNVTEKYGWQKNIEKYISCYQSRSIK